jgi:hypothetical protein
MKGDGVSFEVRPQTDVRLPYYWPPRDPEDLKPSIFSTKYKRMQQTKRLLQKDPMAVLPEEDEFYDSGSASDIDSIGHEEEEIGMYPYYQEQSLHLQQTISENDASTSEEDDDTIPLAQYRRTSPAKKID